MIFLENMVMSCKSELAIFKRRLALVLSSTREWTRLSKRLSLWTDSMWWIVISFAISTEFHITRMNKMSIRKLKKRRKILTRDWKRSIICVRQETNFFFNVFLIIIFYLLSFFKFETISVTLFFSYLTNEK